MKVDNKLITAWIDNSDLEQFIEQNPTGFEYNSLIAETTLVDDILEKVEDIIEEYKEECEDEYKKGHSEGYNEGKEDAEINNAEDVPVIIAEEIGVNFVVEKFKDCKTLDEFQDAYKWIETRSFNFI